MKVHINEVVFRGDQELPPSIMSLQTPKDFFLYFLTDDIVDNICEYTNLRARQIDINTTFETNSDEIRCYIGCLIYMSLYKYPSLDKYWSKNRLNPVADAMSSKKFLLINQFLAFNDYSNIPKKGNTGYDPQYKIRNLVTHFNARFDSVPKPSRLCVDEQMCSTKMLSSYRQYMPNKPHKWGMKLFVLCDTSGFSYRFEVYHGASDNIVSINCPDLGATANVVIRLCQSVSDFKNHIIYFDNFYTTLPLLVYLRARGIFSLGTIRANRINNCKLPADEDIKKKERGFSTEFVGTAYGVDIATVVWKDTKSVRLASTYVGIEPFSSQYEKPIPKAMRYNRKDKAYNEINCPNIIREYNFYMGGVDSMEALLGRYHIRNKTNSASRRLFNHFIDMSVVNAYLLFRRVHGNKYNLPDFRESIAEALCPKRNVSLGRPKNQRQNNLGRRNRTYHPVSDIRFDNQGHTADIMDRKGKRTCKWEGCNSQTQIYCMKCNVNLCLTPERKCFHLYHTK